MGGRRRRGLADLIGEVGTAPQERGEEGPGTGAATAAAREVGRESRLGGRRTATPAQPLPKYLALQRKETRLRGDQVDALASLARRMNRSKAKRGGERITENTLIRVAVDWFLSREELVGASSEEEIRRGLGVPAPGARSGPV
jgi:hypothetical protein